MDERMRFVIRFKDGESMASLCREFGISRKTGYKIFERYENCGLEGLTDRARRPFRYANQLPARGSRHCGGEKGKTALGCAQITVMRDARLARAWLKRELSVKY